METSLLPIIVLLPLLGAAFNGFFGKRLSKRTVSWVAVGSVAGAFAISVLAVLQLIDLRATNPETAQLTSTVWSWISTDMLHVDVAFLLDPLSAVMLLVVGFCIFGFASAFELSQFNAWHVVYTVLAFGALAVACGVLWVLWKPRR